MADYYAQVRSQAKLSFWFSLVFASIGFLLIVHAAIAYSNAPSSIAGVQFFVGAVLDAAAALFFVESKRAHTSMAEYFDKLRRDRNQVEARKLCEQVESAEARDALRVRLSLHYAEVKSAESVAGSILDPQSRRN